VAAGYLYDPRREDWKMRKLALASLLGLLLGFAPLANAGKLLFGTEESVRFVADTTIQAPAGRLYLGHRVRMHAFLLPYYVESKGLVFGISGQDKKYIPLPPAEELASLKAAGLLPNELPRPELGALDYLFGYSLELLVVGCIGYFFIARRKASR
jgi:hypothetical protein